MVAPPSRERTKDDPSEGNRFVCNIYPLKISISSFATVGGAYNCAEISESL